MSRSAECRELVMDLLETAPGGRLWSDDELLLNIATACEVSPWTVIGQYGALRRAGLIRSAPVKDAEGAVTGWLLARTDEPRPESLDRQWAATVTRKRNRKRPRAVIY